MTATWARDLDWHIQHFVISTDIGAMSLVFVKLAKYDDIETLMIMFQVER